jgi:hypothetical protein
MWKEKPVGLAAERHATWRLADLLSFRKQAGVAISHPVGGFFHLQPSRKQRKASPEFLITTRNTPKLLGKLQSSFLKQRKSAKAC